MAVNGLELSPAVASRAINNWLRLYTYEPDHPTIFELWWEIVTQFQILGKKAHDARLFAAMKFHDCHGIVTFNAADFQRFAPLQILTPEQVLQA